eukprot:4442431-Amphidinium_carterae.1
MRILTALRPSSTTSWSFAAVYFLMMIMCIVGDLGHLLQPVLDSPGVLLLRSASPSVLRGPFPGR